MIGDTIRKKFFFTMSKKFPDGTFVSESFGTEIERVCNTAEDEASLTENVYKATMDEVDGRSKASSLTRILRKTVIGQIAKEQKREIALSKKEDK